MYKKNKVIYDKKYFELDNLFATKYDNLFDSQIKRRGVTYYLNHRVTNFHRKRNKISAIIKGTIDYNVSVEYLRSDNIKVECECPYHKDTNVYCKHVYALILTLKMLYEKEKIINIYKVNCEKINNLIKELDNMVISNKKYLLDYEYSRGLNFKNVYSEVLKMLEDKLDKNNDVSIISLARSSYFYLNSIIDDYNQVIDYIDDGKERVKEETKKIKKVEAEEKKLKRQEAIEEEKENKVDEIVENKYINDDEELSRIAFFGLLAVLFGGLNKPKTSSKTDYLMPWEKDLVNNSEYDPFNFEEEESEEDDYYYEDEK